MRIGALAVVIVVLVVVAWAAIACGGRRDLVGYQRGRMLEARTTDD